MTIDVTFGPDFALVHLPDGAHGVIHAAQAHEIADAYRRAGNHLEEVEREQAAKKDRACARLLNAAFRTHNVTKPGTVTPTTTVFINACDCGRLQGCETCDPPLDVA